MNGSQVQVTGETRIVVHNTGPRDLVFDRVLAIGKAGEIVADVAIPGGRGLGARQWQIYRPQELGLPQEFLNFTVMRSRVERLVLLSARGRTHGSIWGVPPFLEGIIRAYLTTTATTTREYSYITTTAFTTTYTTTVRFPRSGHSLTGEWWESNDGRTWYRVTSNAGRENYLNYYGPKEYFCYGQCCSCATVRTREMSPNVWSIAASLRAGPPGTLVSVVTLDRGGYYGNLYTLCEGWRLTEPATPVILYFRNGDTVEASGIAEYTFSGTDQVCYEECWLDPPTCQVRYTEWWARYRLQAIELVDWDTGEVYASMNQTSLRFEIYRNTIVRFKFVRVEYWSQSWVIQVPPREPDCVQILKDPSNVFWCQCAKQYLPRPAWEKICPEGTACLYVNVNPCCSGADAYNTCLDSWSGSGGSRCVPFTQTECESGVTKTIQVGWSASWSLKPGWSYSGIGMAGSGANCWPTSLSAGSASGTCSATLGCKRAAHVTIVVVFKRA